jgi:prepilin-type N-terminal cleavage/methylation domain-containing protein
MRSELMRQGFTLIEIALALLVTSIGLLALFGLFPVGLEANKAAADETRTAMFAEEVLNGVRAQAALQPWNAIAANIRLPPPTPDVWSDPDNLRVVVTGGGADNFETLVFEKLGTRATASGQRESYRDFGVRYRLEIQDIDAYRKAVRLKVRPGEFGTTNTYVFYTELYNSGR